VALGQRGGSKLALCVAAAMMMGLLGFASVGRAQTITEYPIPTPNSTPETIALGPDGAMWFIESGCSDFNCSINNAKIARITTAGVITEFPPTTTNYLTNIVTAPDGALWFVSECNGQTCDSPPDTAGRITTSGAITRFSLPSTDNNLGGPAVGSDGALWITDAGSTPLVYRATLSGNITPFTVPTGHSAHGIVSGPDGALWFSGSGDNGTDNSIGRITTSGAISEFPIPTANAGVNGATAGPDGALWFTELSGNKIGRITTQGTITEYPLPTLGGSPVGIAAGPDGALWFVEASCTPFGCSQNPAAKIGRITTSGIITEYPLPSGGSAPAHIAAGPDGAMWFTEFVGNKIGRITVPVSASPLVSAVLPSSRSAEVGNAITAFATMINSGSSAATGCAIAPVTPVPANFVYQTTNPMTNALTGSPNTPVSISAGQPQSFVIAFTPNAPVVPTAVVLGFDCSGLAAASSSAGLNTLLYSASTTPVPDVVALGATASNDGTLHITGASGSNAFAVATVNVGASSTVTAAANTGSATLPLAIFLCQTNPQSGQCLAPPTASVSTTINANATPTFAFFATASGAVPFIPQTNRIFVQFSDANGIIRGSTSVAVETQ
jgi:virginiamycin B lyase